MSNLSLNKPAPNFALKNLQGDMVQLSTFRDNKNVFLVFNRGFF